MPETDPGRVDPSELLAYGAALAAISLPVALGVHACAGGTPTGAVWPALAVPGIAGVAALLLAPRVPGPRRAAAAAGIGAGVLTGVALALHAPAYWFSPDTAWHTAKVAAAADGHPWHDPILRVRTIYPFCYHWLLGWPVRAGLPLRAVMTGMSALCVAGTCAALWWAARARLDPVRAAWAALALPLFFHAPTRGYALLPDPSNLSWIPLFVGLGLLLWAEPGRRDAGPPDRTGGGTDRTGGRPSRPPLHLAVAAGALLGLAGLIWYGHLPHLALLTALVAVASRPLAWRVVAGAVAPALVLVVHVLALPDGTGGGAIVAGAGESLGERLAAMVRNALSLSGAAPWSDTPVWIGVLGIGLLGYRLRAPGTSPGAVLPRFAVAVGLCLAWAGLQLRYWEPFSWRYALVLWSLLLLIAATARPWTLAGRSVPPVALAAILALAFVPRWWLPVAWDAARLSADHDLAGAPVAAFIEAHTAPDEPVFASVATWEHAVGCCAPRPNLLDRDGGVYKYAPAAVIESRYRDYLALVSTSSADDARALLAPYGFRYAVIHVADLQRPGLDALARGFEVRVITRDYVVVDLDAPVHAPAAGTPLATDPENLRER